MREVQILGVDDHPMVRRGLQQLFDGALPYYRLLEAGNAGEAHKMMKQARPDLVILDLSMEGTSGIELIKQFKSGYPGVPILVYSMLDEALYARRALRAGARRFVSKQESGHELLAVIRAIINGESKGSTSRQTNGCHNASSLNNGRQVTDELSDREFEVFVQLGQGSAPRHIAEALCISAKTVDTHRRNIQQKLHVDTAHDLSTMAVRWCRDKENLA